LAFSAATVQEIEEDKKVREEDVISVDAESLYWSVWREYVRTLGLSGPTILEKRIHDYMNQGLTMEEAIRRLAKTEKIY
jgi:hypothetical protein